MIARYTRPEIGAIWTDEARFGAMRDVEVAAAEALEGPTPADLDAIRAATFTVDAINEREKITDHYTAAFVDVLAASAGPAGRWIHYGLTSSDVVDTALCWSLRDAADLLLAASSELVGVLKHTAEAHRHTVMVGRTHGVHAEPTTFGAKVALWCLQADRDRARLRAARTAVAVGKLSGAVGTYSNVDPAVERHVCAALGLTPVPATQVVARDRHAEYLWACASVGVTVEQIALELRHLQRTEVREVEEGFRAGQKGSSAMPHKRNPITAERLCGLARILRANLQAGLEDVALWHERDISHSSVERVILPDSSLLSYYLLRRAAALVAGLRVDADRMRTNLWSSHGLVFSQPVLLALVEAGLPRDAAYRIVQEQATRAWEDGVPFRSLLEKDERVPLSPSELDAAFDLDRALRNVGAVFEAVAAVEP
jgi:adenylosuccinate lyase